MQTGLGLGMTRLRVIDSASPFLMYCFDHAKVHTNEAPPFFPFSLPPLDYWFLWILMTSAEKPPFIIMCSLITPPHITRKNAAELDSFTPNLRTWHSSPWLQVLKAWLDDFTFSRNQSAWKCNPYASHTLLEWSTCLLQPCSDFSNSSPFFFSLTLFILLHMKINAITCQVMYAGFVCLQTCLI